jgi:hypothetical protein
VFAVSILGTLSVPSEREREREIAISIPGTLSESENERKRELTWRWFCLLVFENEVRDKGMHVLS